jgi:hypothetical protein
VISDVIKDDIVIPKTDILPADEVGVLPKLEPPQEIVVEPKPIGALRGIFRGRGREIDNFQDEGNRRNSFDMIDSVQNRILE